MMYGPMAGALHYRYVTGVRRLQEWDEEWKNRGSSSKDANDAYEQAVGLSALRSTILECTRDQAWHDTWKQDAWLTSFRERVKPLPPPNVVTVPIAPLILPDEAALLVESQEAVSEKTREAIAAAALARRKGKTNPFDTRVGFTPGTSYDPATGGWVTGGLDIDFDSKVITVDSPDYSVGDLHRKIADLLEGPHKPMPLFLGGHDSYYFKDGWKVRCDGCYPVCPSSRRWEAEDRIFPKTKPIRTSPISSPPSGEPPKDAERIQKSLMKSLAEKGWK